MRLEVNGSFSSSTQTKHIKCRYYFICDKIADNDGLMKFGDDGKTAAMTKLTQLHTYETYHPVHANSLSPDKRRQALASLMNIVKKRDGRVQACACANNSKEQQKEDGAPPIVATDSIMITATINAHE